MLYMVIEHYRNGDPAPVYARFRERGRMMPDGCNYVASWVTHDLGRCFQIMDVEREELLQEWMANWSDIVDFEYVAVMTSAEAASRSA